MGKAWKTKNQYNFRKRSKKNIEKIALQEGS